MRLNGFSNKRESMEPRSPMTLGSTELLAMKDDRNRLQSCTRRRREPAPAPPTDAPGALPQAEAYGAVVATNNAPMQAESCSACEELGKLAHTAVSTGRVTWKPILAISGRPK